MQYLALHFIQTTLHQFTCTEIQCGFVHVMYISVTLEIPNEMSNINGQINVHHVQNTSLYL
jgi:hypothetical protein